MLYHRCEFLQQRLVHRQRQLLPVYALRWGHNLQRVPTRGTLWLVQQHWQVCGRAPSGANLRSVYIGLLGFFQLRHD